MKILQSLTKTLRAAVILPVLAGMLLAAAPAYAANPAQTPQPPGSFREQAQEYALQREKLMLSGLALRIDFARQVAAQTHTWIDWLDSQGKDTTPVAAALAAYEGQIEAAQSAWDGANSTLANPAGFDSDGHVTDSDAARLTLRAGADDLRATHRILVDAGVAFRRAVQDYRLALRSGA